MANPGDLQFDRAEPAAAGAAPTSCTVCRQPLVGSYYAINGRAVCASCRDQVTQHAASGRFITAFLLGLGAAALGAGIYFGIEALTGYEFGLVAVVVGLLVGSAVRKGSRGFGGWRYQALAIGLTYLSVVVTDASLVIRAMVQDKGTLPDSAVVFATPPASPSAPNARAPAVASDSAGTAGGHGTRNPALAIVILLGFALAMPVMIGLQNPLHLVIVGFALYEAWKLNRTPAFTITGPFQIAPAT
ncbi:MAG TPA: hypothetical protein VKB45_01220 [Gemmatimonadales bacterium]|nr:hypothetical protein [Gemmatimonadales bacterium]